MLGNRIDNSYYWYNDEYMYFSFNGIHSSAYHLFIQNTKELTIENTIGASSEYSNAILQEGTYFLGTSRKQKTFKRKCAAEGLTKDKYREMMSWLTVGTTGELIFDTDIYWGWTVVLDTVGDASYFTNNNNNTITVEFEITFKTIGTYLAHSVYPATWISDSEDAYVDVVGTNQYLIPPVVAIKTEERDLYELNRTTQFLLKIQNICNKKQDFNFNLYTDEALKGDINFNVKKELINYASAILKVEYSNQYGINNIEFDSARSLINVNNTIAEDNIYCKQTIQQNGMMQLSSNLPIELYTTNINRFEPDAIVITLDEDSAKLLKSSNYDYICLCKKINNITQYGNTPFVDDENNQNNYIADHNSYIGYFNENTNFNQKNIGKVNVSKDYSRIKLTFINGTNRPSQDELSSYRVYCGYTQNIVITVTDQRKSTEIEFPEISFTTKLISYNNI